MASKYFDAVIVGAGPAGLFCAANLKGIRTAVLEKMKTPGKKLLLSGSGQCNITHAASPAEFAGHYGDASHAAFLKPALRGFTAQDTRNFFEGRGLSFFTTDEGKMFPESRSAADVLDALLAAARGAGAEIFLDERVVSVKKTPDGFFVETPCGTYTCRCLVISTGGKSYPATGSSGEGYLLAESLGHSIIQPRPSLTPVYVDDFSLRELSGISIPHAEIAIFHEGKKTAEHTGDLLITRFGFSGPGILDASRWMEAGDILRISFVPFSESKLDALLVERCAKEGARLVQNLLYGLSCPERLVRELCCAAGVSDGVKGAQLNAKMRRALVKNLTAYEAKIARVGDYNGAMATAGGVSLDEVNAKTCESKLTPGLFFAGEVLDIDGDTGGYNIQAAFSTAYLAAKRICGLTGA